LKFLEIFLLFGGWSRTSADAESNLIPYRMSAPLQKRQPALEYWLVAMGQQATFIGLFDPSVL